MCGIVGYKGNTKSLKFVISTLKKLEYRGYDSAGVASLKNGKIETFKESGNISKLDAVVPETFETNCSIAHTRWATHGKPNQLNAHPHSSKNQTWTIVHNGIIENYLSLKENLINAPESETDTSVVAELLEEKQAQTFDEFIDAFASVDGSYAILALNKNKEDEMFLAKHKSPLYVSQNETGDFLIASDPICFVDFGKSYYVFGDGEFAHITSKEIIFKNSKKQTIKKEKIEMDSIFADASQGEYNHFMLKEIMEQPTAVQRLVKTVRDNDVLSKFQNGWIKNFDEVKFIGCGTAYHAGLVGARYVSKIAGVPASAEVASEFIYNTPVFAGPKKLFVFVSQSGETADTLSAVKIAKEHGSTCIALTNVLYSSLARMVDYVLPVCAGPEIAVASTKAYVCQLSALFLFASALADKNIKNSLDEIEEMSNSLLDFDMKKVEEIADEIKNETAAIFIGKDIDSITASEASLKLKEVAYINTASYPSGELKHGFLALVEEGTPMIVFAGNKSFNQKTFNAANEAVSRGAKEVVLANEKIAENDRKKVFYFDIKNELLFPILSIVPMQYLAYQVSIKKNINPDQPRNLAKSVTVE